MKVRIWIETKKVGSRCERIVDYPDDMTEDELDTYTFEEVADLGDWGWERVEEA